MLYKPSGSLPSSGPNRKSGGGGSYVNIIVGIILLLIGIAFIANVFISYSLAGGFFGMFMLVLGFVILAWSAPKVQKPS